MNLSPCRTPLHKLQTHSFAVTALKEYVDHHPQDEEAARLLQTCQKAYLDKLLQYERCRGTLIPKFSAYSKLYLWGEQILS